MKQNVIQKSTSIVIKIDIPTFYEVNNFYLNSNCSNNKVLINIIIEINSDLLLLFAISYKILYDFSGREATYVWTIELYHA